MQLGILADEKEKEIYLSFLENNLKVNWEEK